MEEIKLFTFTFDGDCLDEYQRGFISGLMYMLIGQPSTTWCWCRGVVTDDSFKWYKDLDCTAKQASEIAKEIEKHFPGALIDFS